MTSTATDESPSFSRKKDKKTNYFRYEESSSKESQRIIITEKVLNLLAKPKKPLILETFCLTKMDSNYTMNDYLLYQT